MAEAGLTKFTLTCAILASMTSFLAGFHDDGDLSSKAEHYFINENETFPKIYILIIIFNFIVPLAAGTFSDLIGRKYSLATSSVFFFLGSLVTSLAPNYVLFVTGALLAVTGTCLALSVTHVYIAELAPDPTRGFLTTLPEVFLSIGYLLDDVFDHISYKKIAIWRLEMGLGTIPSFSLALAMLFVLPESPGWLVTRGKLSEARRVLIRTSFSEEEAELRLGVIKSAVESKQSCGWADSWKKLLLHPSTSIRRALIAVVGLNFFRNSTGNEAVHLYSSRLLTMARVKRGDIIRVT